MMLTLIYARFFEVKGTRHCRRPRCFRFGLLTAVGRQSTGFSSCTLACFLLCPGSCWACGPLVSCLVVWLLFGPPGWLVVCLVGWLSGSLAPGLVVCVSFPLFGLLRTFFLLWFLGCVHILDSLGCRRLSLVYHHTRNSARGAQLRVAKGIIVADARDL